MEIVQLTVRNVRIIESADIAFGGVPGCIVGANGSGKTSILEAVHLLSTGRSFRTRHGRRVLRDGEATLRVDARMRRSDGVPRRVAFVGGSERSRLFVDGERVRSASEAARAAPVAVFRPESHRLVEGGASERRALIDWTLFHVEQTYAHAHRRFRRALEQRNRVLRGGDRRQLRVWTEAVAGSGEDLERLRRVHMRGYLQRLHELLADVITREIELDYAPGWAVERSLEECLMDRLDQDMRLGSTSVGPQRADLRARARSVEARQVLSRGEAKLLAAAMIAAQVDYVTSCTGEPPLLLVDDLTSELDRASVGRLLRLLSDVPAQVIVTALEPLDVDLSVLGQVRMFHVEQGRISGPVE